MKHRRRLAALVALFAAGSMVPITAGAAPQNVIVSPTPIEESPRVLDGSIYAIVEAGNKIIVGGSFTSVRNWNSATPMTRNHIFAFDPTTGIIDPNFTPSFDKDVNAVVPTADGQSVYVGGAFKAINGATRKGLVKMSVADGTIDPTFKATTNRDINDMAMTGTRLIVGGRFSKIGNVARSLLGAVDTTTGAVVDSLNLPVTQTRNANSPYIQELDVSPNGSRLAIVGNFLSVGGIPREQIALVDLTTTPATVANWATTRYHQDCAPVFNNTYLRDVAFSPDSTFLIAVTTGAFFANSLCDTASRWEVNQAGTTLQPTWVTYTGGDTHWHVLITEAAAYVGGHQRWENNPTPSFGGDNDGPGSVSRQGIAALDPLTGVPLSWNPGRHRGSGVESFLATADRLYVGSDTEFFANLQRERLAVLPVAGGVANPAPDVPTLPVNLYWARTDGNLYRGSFDGSAVTGTTLVNGPSADWQTMRDGFVQKGQLFYFGAAEAYYKRSFDGTTPGPVTNLSTSVGYVDTNAALTPYDQPYNVNTTRAVAYHQGRLYYTRTNDPRLFWRWFSLESGIIGAQEFVANSSSWTGVTGLEIVGDQLYASWSDNRLYRVTVSGPVVSFAWTLVNDGNTSGIPWAQVRGLFVRD